MVTFVNCLLVSQLCKVHLFFWAAASVCVHLKWWFVSLTSIKWHFSNKNISRGSVVMYLRYDEISRNDSTANLLLTLTGEGFENQLRFNGVTAVSLGSFVYTQCVCISITMVYPMRTKYPLSVFNYHLSNVNVANFNKIHCTVSVQQLFLKKSNLKTEVSNMEDSYLLYKVLRVMT